MLEDKIMLHIHVIYVNCIDYFEKEKKNRYLNQSILREAVTYPMVQHEKQSEISNQSKRSKREYK